MTKGVVGNSSSNVPSPYKEDKRVSRGLPSLMLPDAAFQSSQYAALGTPILSPLGQPIRTPVNAATTTWRTQLCPNPPVKRVGLQKSMSIDSTPASTPKSLPTPANLWPSPGVSPMLTGAWPTTPGVLHFSPCAGSVTSRGRFDFSSAGPMRMQSETSATLVQADAISDPGTPSPSKQPISPTLELLPSCGPLTPDEKPARASRTFTM